MGQQLRLKTSWAYQSHLIRENTRLVIPPIVAKPVKTLNLQSSARQKNWEPFAQGLNYLEGHELEAFLLAKIRLLVFFRGVF